MFEREDLIDAAGEPRALRDSSMALTLLTSAGAGLWLLRLSSCLVKGLGWSFAPCNKLFGAGVGWDVGGCCSCSVGSILGGG